MMSAHSTDPAALRIRVALGLMIAAFCLLAFKLWGVQVAEASRYIDREYKQTVRRVRLPGYRGGIYDRSGEPLAANRPSYCVAMYIEEFRKPGKWENTIREVQATIEDLAALLELEPSVSEDDIRAHVKRRLPLPMFVWKDVDRRVMARLAERQDEFPGVEIVVDPVRVYPQGAMLSHVLGYVRKVGPQERADDPSWKDDDGNYHFYIPEMDGTRGIERSCNEVLVGKAGGRLIRVDATGYQRTLVQDKTTMHERRPEAGGDVYLAVDAKIQRLVEETLGGTPGAAVVLNPRNGDVLAVASAPTFDPNEFVPSISQARWDEIRNDAAKPLHDRAVGGLYPPGSTFKPVVAIAALENHLATPERMYNCSGSYPLGRGSLKCWISRYGRGHGDLKMIKSLEQSCNVYYCKLAVDSGYEVVFHTAKAMGLGMRTGVGIDGEQKGLLPRPRDVRSRGDLCNLSVGQGALAVTPLQMASLTATIATGGKVYKPRLILRETQRGSSEVKIHPPVLVRDLGWSAETVSTIQRGMHDVVNSPHGTGKRARVEGVVMAGKTGTAEYGVRDQYKKRGWMIAYVPYERPEYAIAIVIDDAVSGGVTVGPLMNRIVTGLYFPDRLIAAEEAAALEADG